MKKLIQKTTAVLALSALATAALADTTFTTVQQAEQYCPSTSNLVFTPANTVTPYSKGKISAYKSAVQFKNLSTDGYAIHPKSLNGDTIAGVTFRESNGMYGYISGQAITCLYNYPGFTGIPYFLVMRGTS